MKKTVAALVLGAWTVWTFGLNVTLAAGQAGEQTTTEAGAEADQPPIEPLVRVVDLDVGQQVRVELADGTEASVHLLEVNEMRDPIRQAIRKAEVLVEINGQRCTLEAGLYNLPIRVGGVQVDCAVTAGYNQNNLRRDYALHADARLRLWPADSPLVRPGTFRYPVKQRWFATLTWMDIEPIDGGTSISNQVAYHNGCDIGGAEGMVEVVAATDALVVSSGLQVLEGHQQDTPVQPRYDVVYLRDGRGWYYRYSHFQSIDPQIVTGRRGQTRRPAGGVGQRRRQRRLVAPAFSHLQSATVWRMGPAECLRLPARGLLQAVRAAGSGLCPASAVDPGWRHGDPGRQPIVERMRDDPRVPVDIHRRDDGRGARVERTYPAPGKYSEILRVTDSRGNIDYDFAVVQVIDPAQPDLYAPSLHATYAPTFDIRPGDPVTFQVRASRITEGDEVWDFGDGSPPVRTRSDGNLKPLAPDGYATVVHRYAQPGHYLIHVSRQDDSGAIAHAHLHVRVEAE
jgi:hypothetical protein